MTYQQPFPAQGTLSSNANLVAYPSVRRFGYWAATTINTAQASGLLSDNTAVGATGIASAYDANEDLILTCTSSATAGTNAGCISPTFGVGVGRPVTNIHMQARAAANAHDSGTRMFFGLTSNAVLPISDTILANTDSGIIIGFSSSTPNWTIFNNDGSGAMVSTSYTGNIATDTLYHTLDILVVKGGGSVIVTLDNNASVTLATRIPSTATNLYCDCVVQNTVAFTRAINIKYVQAEAYR